MRFCSEFYGVIFLLGFAYISEISGYSMIGCYLYDPVSHALNGSEKTFAIQSSQICGDFCTKQFVYAGIRNGYTCMCGNTLPDPSTQVPDSSMCNIPCTGAPQEKCGGTLYTSVWIVGSQTSNSPSRSENKGALIGGVVGGVLGFLLVLGGGFWWYRKKQRNHKVNHLNTEKFEPNGTESWVTRRRSDVSLRDDFDYTHTLKVTNPDP